MRRVEFKEKTTLGSAQVHKKIIDAHGSNLKKHTKVYSENKSPRSSPILQPPRAPHQKQPLFSVSHVFFQRYSNQLVSASGGDTTGGNTFNTQKVMPGAVKD